MTDPNPPVGAPTGAVGTSGTSARIVAKTLHITSITTVAGDCRAEK